MVFGGRIAGAEGEEVSDEIITLAAQRDSLSLVCIEQVTSHRPSKPLQASSLHAQV